MMFPKICWFDVDITLVEEAIEFFLLFYEKHLMIGYVTVQKKLNIIRTGVK